MNRSVIRYMLAKVILLTGVCMLFPFIVSLFYKESIGFIYLACSIICLVVGQLLSYKPSKTSFYAREGFLVVSLSWIVISIIGAIPFYVGKELPSFTDSLFEIVSGFTTTGASVAADVEAYSHASLFWRTFSHWFGGMGVLVFLLAILPSTGGQTLYFMKAESPGPSVGKLVPKMQSTAKYLYSIYAGLTAIETIFLLFGGMNFFDAICTAFGTAGTGGFGNYGTSIGGFNTYIQIVVTVFMMLFGVNFNAYFLIVMKRFKEAAFMEEVRWYFRIYASAVLAITLNLTLVGGNFLTNLQQAAFQGASVMTTTGFSTLDFNLWPHFSKVIMLMLMFIGACAGSTGGGIKVSRILIYLKTVYKELQHLISPRNIKIVMVENKPVDHDVVRSVNIFLIAYLAIFAGSVAIVSLDNFDAATTFSSVVATLNNIGPGLNLVGPMGNFAMFSNLSKYVLMFDMLAGRLEIFPMLLLFMPKAWTSR